MSSSAPGPPTPPNNSNSNNLNSPNPQRPPKKHHHKKRSNKNNKNDPNSKPKSKSNKNPKKVDRDPKNNYRYQQIRKLLKKFTPVTINGLPIRMISHQAEELNENEAINLYLQNFIKNQMDQAIYLSFLIVPSDPDFPFDLDVLKISLCVPPEYPVKSSVVPSIYVLNDEIPRGFAANIELGFKRISTLAVTGKDLMANSDVESENFPLTLVDGKGLLSQVLTLDKYLESFLRMEKRKTIKFVRGKPKSKESTPVTPPVADLITPKSEPIQVVKPVNVDESERSKLISQVSQKLSSSIKLFGKSKTYTTFKVFLPINTPEEIPESWIDQGKIELILRIPVDFPDTKLSIEITKQFLHRTGYYKEYESNLVKNFNLFEFGELNVVEILNYLSNNINVFCMKTDDFQVYNELVRGFTI